MDDEARSLLVRWQSLERGDGLKRAQSVVQYLTAAGFVLWLVVVVGLYFRFHPAAIAAFAAVTGWVIAERNALRIRLAQWPVFSRYVDWRRVQEDLDDAGQRR